MEEWTVEEEEGREKEGEEGGREGKNETHLPCLGASLEPRPINTAGKQTHDRRGEAGTGRR